MSSRYLTLGLLTSLLCAVSGAVARESATDKERRKGLDVANTSTTPWVVGVDADADMNGDLEIMELNKAKTAFTQKGKLKKGAKLNVPVDGEVLLSPVPPKKWMGMARTGVDFSAKLYLQDSKGGKLFLTLNRASGGTTEKKTCYFTFFSGFVASRFEPVLLLTPGGGDFADQYVSPVTIVGNRLPPPPPRP